MFVDATTEQAYLKVGLYGGPGSGKTFTALQCATRLGSTAVIDTERGSDFYAKVFSFKIIHAVSVSEVTEGVVEAVEKNFQCLIIDQMTHIWEDVQEEYIAGEHEKMSKAWAFIEKNDQIPFQGWRRIKKPYKKLIHLLIDAPLHVFILGRLAIEYEVTGGEPKKIGERMDAEKNTPYEPHILIKMEYVKKRKLWYAYIEKDRSGTIQGEMFTNPDGTMLDLVLAKLGKLQGELPQGKEDTAEGTSGDGNQAEASQMKLIRVLARKGGIKDEVTEGKLEGLTRIQAAQLVNDMTLGKFKFFK